MANMTTKQAALALRKASRLVDEARRTDRVNRTVADTCRMVGEALSMIQDAQIVLRNDECWRRRDELDMQARISREASA